MRDQLLRQPSLIDLVEDKNSIVTPTEFLGMLENDSHNIGKVRFQPPKFGDSSFGHFVIERKNKRYGKIANVR